MQGIYTYIPETTYVRMSLGNTLLQLFCCYCYSVIIIIIIIIIIEILEILACLMLILNVKTVLSLEALRRQMPSTVIPIYSMDDRSRLI